MRKLLVLLALLLPVSAGAITFVAAGTACHADLGSSCNPGQPAGIQNGDILILQAQSSGDAADNLTVNNGYTQKSESDGINCNQHRGAVFWKRTTGSEATTTCSNTQSTALVCRITAWRGAVSSGDPIEVFGSWAAFTSGSNAVASSITTVTNGAMVLKGIFANFNPTWSSHTGLPTTEAYDYSHEGVNSSVSQVQTYGTDVTAGSTGSSSSTQSGTAGSGCTVQYALKPTTNPPGVPGNPTYSSITTTAARVSWTAATDAVSYKVARAPDSGGSPGTFVDVYTGVTALFKDDSGLTAGNRYWYKIRGTNDAGDGSYSGSTKLTLLPVAPGNATYTNITTTSVKVNWTAANGADTYKVEQASYSGTCGTYVQIASGVNALFKDVTGLTINTTYCFRVRATNATGDGAYNTGTTVTTANDPPGAPGNATYTNIGGTTVTVNWTAATGAESYKLERAPHAGACGTYVETDTGITNLFKNVTGLSLGTTYCFRMRGTNGAGDGAYSTGTTVTTLSLPGTPGNATFTNIAGQSLTVNWTAASGATSYKVERAPFAGSCGTYAQIAAGVTDIFYNDSGLSTSTTYCYKVRATNGAGDGSYNTAQSVTTSSSIFSTGWLRYGCWAPDGNCFAVKSNGARIDFGAGVDDYASSDGTYVSFAGPLSLGNNISFHTKDSGGTQRRLSLLSSSNHWYFGDLDRAFGRGYIFDNDGVKLQYVTNAGVAGNVPAVASTDDTVPVADGTKHIAAQIPDCNSTDQALNYDQATNAFSCRTLAPSWTPAMITTSYTNATTSATDIGGLSFAESASTRYSIRGDLIVATSAATDSTNVVIFRVKGTSACTNSALRCAFGVGMNGTYTWESTLIAYDTDAAFNGYASDTANQPFGIGFRCHMECGASGGTFQLQARSASGTTTIYRGSYLEYKAY